MKSWLGPPRVVFILRGRGAKVGDGKQTKGMMGAYANLSPSYFSTLSPPFPLFSNSFCGAPGSCIARKKKGGFRAFFPRHAYPRICSRSRPRDPRDHRRRRPRGRRFHVHGLTQAGGRDRRFQKWLLMCTVIRAWTRTRRLMGDFLPLRLRAPPRFVQASSSAGAPIGLPVHYVHDIDDLACIPP